MPTHWSVDTQLITWGWEEKAVPSGSPKLDEIHYCVKGRDHPSLLVPLLHSSVLDLGLPFSVIQLIPNRFSGIEVRP